MTPEEKTIRQKTESKNPLSPHGERAGVRGLRLLVIITIVATVFIAGLAAGAYYQTELWVLWRGFTTKPQPLATNPPAATLQPVSSDTSIIKLPQVSDPLPLVFSDTLDEPKIQDYLQQGAVVLPLGTTFGEQGNVVVTAHSSGTQSFGPYRFAFSKLAELKSGDEFTVETGGAKYTYKVYGQDIVWPHEVDKLPQDDRSTVTLVTCWPLWTNFKRLLVHSELTKVEYR